MLLTDETVLPGYPLGTREQTNRERLTLVQRGSYRPSWIIRPIAAYVSFFLLFR